MSIAWPGSIAFVAFTALALFAAACAQATPSTPVTIVDTTNPVDPPEAIPFIELSASGPAAASADPSAEGPMSSGECVGLPSRVLASPRPTANACCYQGQQLIQETVRTRFADLRACYDAGLARNPSLRGRLTAKFTIEADGAVLGACNAGSTLGDEAVIECALTAFTKVRFAPYDETFCRAAAIVYPIELRP